MLMPISILPGFIGKLIKLQEPYTEVDPVWHQLWLAIRQCRSFNSDDNPAIRQSLWKDMTTRTWPQLAALGVTI